MADCGATCPVCKKSCKAMPNHWGTHWCGEHAW